MEEFKDVEKFIPKKIEEFDSISLSLINERVPDVSEKVTGVVWRVFARERKNEREGKKGRRTNRGKKFDFSPKVNFSRCEKKRRSLVGGFLSGKEKNQRGERKSDFS